jgi:hypothetical protein
VGIGYLLSMLKGSIQDWRGRSLIGRCAEHDFFMCMEDFCGERGKEGERGEAKDEKGKERRERRKRRGTDGCELLTSFTHRR